MKSENNSYILGETLKKLVPRIGASVLLEPGGFAGLITFKNGKKSYFKYTIFDLNPVGSAEIAKDKDYASFFMKELGYPVVPQSKVFFSKEWSEIIGIEDQGIDEAYEYAKEIEFPVIVKPNSGYWGIGVSLVYNKRELYQALTRIFMNDRIALVQKFVTGKDYRIVVLDDKVISAYQRIPLSVVGDGKLTIGNLLLNKQKKLVKESSKISLVDSQFSIKLKLKHQGLSLDSVVKKGEQVFLLDSANLSTGGDSIDVMDKISRKFKKLAVQLTKDMNLRLCGVDLMVDGDITKDPDKYHVLEVNGSPGMGHYTKINKDNAKIIEDFYLKILKSLEKN